MHAFSSLALLAALSATGDSTLLEFASGRCTHCQAMQPAIAQLAQIGVSVQVIDVDQQPEVVRQFRITGVPTFVAVSSAGETGRIEGVTSADKLAALVKGTGAQGAGVAAHAPAAPGQGSGGTEAARAATVRVKVEDAGGYGFGTGTIIDTHDAEALVVTCGHLFRESQGRGKITADLFVGGSTQTVDGQLIGFDLDRDIALISLKASAAPPAVLVAPPGYTVRPGDRAFTLGCDKGADPTLRPTHITAVNKYKGKPNYTAAGQPIDGRSGGGLFTAEGYLIGICNAADPADDEGLYAGLASIHWQLDQIGQSEIYQRSAKVAATGTAARPANGMVAASQATASQAALAPQLPATMPAGPITGSPALAGVAPPSAVEVRAAAAGLGNLQAASGAIIPVANAADDAEIVFIVRSKRDPSQRSEVFVVDQAPPDLIARITHAAAASGQQRAAVAQAARAPTRTAAANALPGSPRVIRGQSNDY
jgi:thiol-disulfide isomerase/thioredoxin